MSKLDTPLDGEQLARIAERVARLPAADAEWVGVLLEEVLRARAHEAAMLAGQLGGGQPLARVDGELDDELAQLALDTAAWLKALWSDGYMGAGNFRSSPRSDFPAIDLEDVRKSSLLARIRQGKCALPFAPPTRHGLPWHDLLDGETHAVEAEIVYDEAGVPLAAIIEACTEWQVVAERIPDRQYLVQHQGKGPVYRLCLDGSGAGELRREPPALTSTIVLHGREGFHGYTLEWQGGDGRTQLVPLRAATWERAESEAEHWLAKSHPEMYGQVRFELRDE